MPSRDAVRILATATMAVAVLIPCAVIGSEEDEEPSFGERFGRSLVPCADRCRRQTVC